ncbi:UBX domain-containing protein [Blumeria hordei DH14]|uniref:UBX domain-containing protein n=1 Tax=Blumeria graminis f. sp. hordei (strain DH14) TaxID=546991 RepID=N1J9C3_BLUG1|nr:UBX domain-containing protein [Blumeria hordei DH14]
MSGSPPDVSGEKQDNAAGDTTEDTKARYIIACDDCEEKFRSKKEVENHCRLSGHLAFSEIPNDPADERNTLTEEEKAARLELTQEKVPLTEEEKAAKLEELRIKSRERKAKQAIIDLEEQRKNEKIRRKSTKEVQDAKEDLARQEQMKIAAKKRQEKLDDIAAKKRVQEKIAADREARRLRMEASQAQREGRPTPAKSPTIPETANKSPAPISTVKDARLRLVTAGGTLTKTFPAETTLFEVGQQIELEVGGPITSFTTTYPKKTLTGNIDFGMTLKEAGLLPSAVLIVA